MPAGRRAYWKGYLRLSLVSVGIELFDAEEKKAQISFNQIHKPTGRRINYVKSVQGVGPVDKDDIVSGYEIDKDRYVTLDPEELDAVKLESKGPAFYRQRRVGLYGETFEVIKLRSMRTDAEVGGKAVWAQKDDPRVTRVGRFIRKVRLDELPQLWNVLKGEMSFIGPRPERPQFVADLARKIRYYDLRHCLKPGLAGWAQLRFPYGASEEDAAEKLKYDLYYVKNQNLLFDVMILIQTVEVVLFRRGAR